MSLEIGWNREATTAFSRTWIGSDLFWGGKCKVSCLSFASLGRPIVSLVTGVRESMCLQRRGSKEPLLAKRTLVFSFQWLPPPFRLVFILVFGAQVRSHVGHVGVERVDRQRARKDGRARLRRRLAGNFHVLARGVCSIRWPEKWSLHRQGPRDRSGRRRNSLSRVDGPVPQRRWPERSWESVHLRCYSGWEFAAE